MVLDRGGLVSIFGGISKERRKVGWVGVLDGLPLFAISGGPQDVSS